MILVLSSLLCASPKVATFNMQTLSVSVDSKLSQALQLFHTNGEVILNLIRTVCLLSSVLVN